MAGCWPTAESDPAATRAMLAFARIWEGKPKIVLSGTLERVEWNSRLVRANATEEIARPWAQPGSTWLGRGQTRDGPT